MLLTTRFLSMDRISVGQGFSPVSAQETPFGGSGTSSILSVHRAGTRLRVSLPYGASHAVKRTPISPSITGSVVGFRLSGVEPDGDPLYEVLLQTALSASGSVPRTHLIVDAYMENFKPDTTPILPDLLHPTHTAQNLGGFLEGKALLTDDAGAILYRGSFTAEAFLDNTNHLVVTLYRGESAQTAATLKGSFTLHKDGTLSGPLTGSIALSQADRQQLQRHAGAKMRSIKKILAGVTVTPHPMVGRSSAGASSTPLSTGFSQTPTAAPASHTISPLTIVAGIGAALSFLCAGFLWWWQRRHPTVQKPADAPNP